MRGVGASIEERMGLGSSACHQLDVALPLLRIHHLGGGEHELAGGIDALAAHMPAGLDEAGEFQEIHLVTGATYFFKLRELRL